jgi:hypothetical protein
VNLLNLRRGVMYGGAKLELAHGIIIITVASHP